MAPGSAASTASSNGVTSGSTRCVARALRRTGATQVHAFEGAALYTLRAAKRRGLRTVLDVPSAHEYNIAIAEAEAAATGAPRARQFGSSARVRAERLAADVIVTPSAYVSRCLLSHGVDASKIVEIPFGADPELYTPPAPTSRSGRFVLLDVASINYRKGTRYLLQAWRELALPDAELVLAGAPDDAGRRVLAEYEGSYRHLGHVAGADLPALFRSASAFVLPSLAEGSALVTYMAMAVGAAGDRHGGRRVGGDRWPRRLGRAIPRCRGVEGEDPPPVRASNAGRRDGRGRAEAHRGAVHLAPLPPPDRRAAPRGARRIGHNARRR